MVLPGKTRRSETGLCWEEAKGSVRLGCRGGEQQTLTLAPCHANGLGFQLGVIYKQRFLKHELIQAVMTFNTEFRQPRRG